MSRRSVGALIALYDRAVGFTARCEHHAYHQRRREAGKKAAAIFGFSSELFFRLC